MSEIPSQEEALDRAVIALEPDSVHCVIVGGWALRLLARRPEAVPLPREPLVTTDLDVALRAERSTPATGELDRRLADAGFVPVPSGSALPPVIAHVMQTSSGPFSVDFVSPLVGATRGRDGRERPTEVRLGVTAQRIARLQTALASTWSVTHVVMDSETGHPREVGITVPSPAAYVDQKILSMDDRPSRAKRERDLLYIADALLLFNDALPEIAATERPVIASSISARERARLRARMRALSVISDLHRGAARQARDAGMLPLDDVGNLVDTLAIGLQRLGDI